MAKETDNKTLEEVKAKPCPQDCGKCSPWQQMYCCTKMAFDLSNSFDEMKELLNQLNSKVDALASSLPSKTKELSTPKK